MSNNKERILRDLEYVSGGITTLRTLSANKKDCAATYNLFEEWQDIICSIIDMIEEDYDNASKS